MTQTILNVGPGQQFATIGAAIAASNRMGGNADIRVAAGVYLNDGGALLSGVNNVTIEGVGGLARIVDPNFLAEGGAAIVTAGDNITLKNLDISDVTSSDGSGAGVRSLRGVFLTFDHVHLHNNQNGFVTGNDAGSVVTIQNSEIDHNGTGDGQTGNVRIGNIYTATLNNSYVHDGYGGSEIESRADGIVVQSSRIYDNASNSSYSIDLPVGGSLALTGSTIEQGAGSSSSTIISWGEQLHVSPNRSLYMASNVIVNNQSSSVATLVASRGNPTIYGYDNKLWSVGYLGTGVPQGMIENARSRPALDTSSAFAPLQPAISFITGIPNTGVRLTGTSNSGSTVTVTDTVGSQTTILGTTTASASGAWTFTSVSELGHIDLSTVHHYSVTAQDSFGDSGSMPGALFLTDTGNDTIVGASGVQDVFAIMSFKGNDLIQNFQTATQVGSVHDVINFSGRGLTSFSQVQSMMSGAEDATLTLAGGKMVTLVGVTPASLTAADFRFS